MAASEQQDHARERPPLARSRRTFVSRYPDQSEPEFSPRLEGGYPSPSWRRSRQIMLASQTNLCYNPPFPLPRPQVQCPHLAHLAQLKKEPSSRASWPRPARRSPAASPRSNFRISHTSHVIKKGRILGCPGQYRQRLHRPLPGPSDPVADNPLGSPGRDRRGSNHTEA